MPLLRTLGSVALVDRSAGSEQHLEIQQKRLALLVFLARGRSGHLVRRDVLLSLFWPESDEQHGRGVLRQALTAFRKQLGADVLVTRGEDEVGLAADGLLVDATAFEDACRSGKFESARDLYRGHFLAGFHASGVAPEFEQWVDVEREQLRRLASDASWRVALQCESSGRPADAVTSARHAVELDPDDEMGVARLIALLDRQGDRSGALTVYAALERRLADGFSARPAPETRALMQTLRQRPTPAARSGSFALDAPAPPAQAWRSSRRSRRPLIIAGAIGALITVVLVALLGPRAPPSALIRNNSVVAVVPFRLHAPDSDLGWLQDGMVELLTMRLSESDAFSVVEPGRVLAAWGDTPSGQGGIGSDEALRRLAEKVGAGRVVRGSLNGTRGHLILAAWIIDMPGGQTVAQASVEGPADSLPVLVDRLATQLLGRTEHAARQPPPQ